MILNHETQDFKKPAAQQLKMLWKATTTVNKMAENRQFLTGHGKIPASLQRHVKTIKQSTDHHQHRLRLSTLDGFGPLPTSKR